MRKIFTLLVGVLLLSSISFAQPINITIQPQNDSVCDATPATFTVVATGATSYLWYLSENGGTTWTALTRAPYYDVSTATLNINPATYALNTYLYECVLTNSGTTVTSAAATLIIKEPPISVITPEGTISICQGESETLTASPGFGNSYSWYFGGNPIGVNQTYNATESGDYEVIITNNGCSTPSNHVFVIVNPIPTVTVTANPTAICAGQETATLTATPAEVSYIWNTSATTQSITVSNGNVYSITVTDVNGCTGISSDSVTVNTPPTVTVTSNPTAICVGQTATLTATPAEISYIWNTSATTQSITVSDGTVHSVTVTDVNGCTGVGSDSVTVNIPPTVTVIANPTAICVGQTATLTAMPAGDTYIWDTEETAQFITVSDSNVYSVTVTDVNGCTGIGSDSVTVNTPPTVTVTANPTAICVGQTATLTATPAEVLYIWNTSATTQSITVSDGNVYFVTVTDVNGCTGVGSDSVTVNTPPTVTVTSNPTAICVGQTATLTAMPAEVSYIWNTSATTQSITVSDGTVHSVTVTDVNGCTGVGSDSVTVNIPPTVTVIANPTAICVGQTATLTALWPAGKRRDHLPRSP